MIVTIVLDILSTSPGNHPGLTFTADWASNVKNQSILVLKMGIKNHCGLVM